MIIHLDSTYRNIDQYPYPSEFEIDVNGQPPPSSRAVDIRSQYATDDYAQYSFQWIGNTTIEPLSTRDNDALEVKYVAINAFSCILVDNSDSVKQLRNDYFVGTLFFDTTTKQSSPVTVFQRDIFLIRVADPIFKQFCSLTYTEYIRSSQTKSIASTAYFVNPSYSTGKNLLLLGSTKLVPETETEVFLAKGLNTNLFIENVTKGWTSKVESIEGRYRSVILETFPSYDSDDYFIAWKIPTYTGIVRERLFILGIMDFQIIESSCGFAVRDIVQSCDESVICEVTRVTCDGKVLELQCRKPGQHRTLGEVLPLSCTHCRDKQVSIHVLSVQNGLLPTQVPPVLLSSQRYIVAFLHPFNFSMIYLSMIPFRSPVVIYLDASDNIINLLNQLLFDSSSSLRAFYLIPYTTIFPSIVATIIPYQNPVCYEVSISTISLPNLPVCGINVLLADLPYILVTLSNSNGSSIENYNTLISNNPNTNTANFVCPIANIRNPDIVKFVVVRSYQSVVFKFTPRNSLFFRVTLPNGQLLRYTDTSIPYSYPCDVDGNYPITSGCSSINQPLTVDSNNANGIRVYPLELTNLISATFLFRPLY